jgi:hypothetical protein
MQQRRALISPCYDAGVHNGGSHGPVLNFWPLENRVIYTVVGDDVTITHIYKPAFVLITENESLFLEG